MQGELGLGETEIGNYQDAQAVLYKGKVAQISAGVAHASAVTKEGRLLVWGSNRQNQLGYPSKLREVYRPVFFGGLIEGTSITKEEGEEMKSHPKVYFDATLGLQYKRVECGSAQTVALVDKSPYLLIWGYGSHQAWGFPDLFHRDKPVHF